MDRGSAYISAMRNTIKLGLGGSLSVSPAPLVLDT
jgi:hypothetical protein